jgi:hypothetical protein
VHQSQEWHHHNVFHNRIIIILNGFGFPWLITNLAAMPVSEGEDGWFRFSKQVHSCNNCWWHREYHPLMPSNRVAGVQCKENLAA